MSSSQMVDLVFLYFILIFILFSIYFLTFLLFLEYKIRFSDGHELQDAWNEVEGSRTNDVIQHGYHMLTSCSIHGHLE